MILLSFCGDGYPGVVGSPFPVQIVPLEEIKS